MYSYEERIRAVKLYIKLGRRLGATLRKLGYPTKNSLISWYREYEREQDLQVGYSRAPSKYSAEQKQRAVQHYLDHDQCIASTLRALGYPCRTYSPDGLMNCIHSYADAWWAEHQIPSIPQR